MRISAGLFVILALGALVPLDAQQPGDMMNAVQDLAWSPNGKHIYFSAMRVKTDYSDFKPDKWSVYRYDLKTRAVLKIADAALYVSVSPSGKKIAIGKLVDGNRDIYVLDADGKHPTGITNDPAEDFAPSWSPDGKKIAFNNRANRKPEIYVINADGTGLRRLTNGSGESRSYNPIWSPDGKHIVYYAEKGDRKDQIHVMNPDGTESRNITNDEFNNIFPGWAGRNRIIYGQGTIGGPTRVFTVNVDGTDKKQLLTLESFYARASRDGSKIAFVHNDRSIRIVSTNGTEIHKIVL